MPDRFGPRFSQRDFQQFLRNNPEYADDPSVAARVFSTEFEGAHETWTGAIDDWRTACDVLHYPEDLADHLEYDG